MIKVANCLVEDYIHSSKLKNFCAEHKMPVSENKPDLFKKVIEYAGTNAFSEEYKNTYKWFLDTIKSGSKEFCLKRIFIPEDTLEDIEQIIKNNYPDCPHSDLLSYKNTEQFELVDYSIIRNDQNIVTKISFMFSRLVLEGDTEFEKGDRIIYPVYIDFYVETSFVVARYKPKTTLYTCSENDIIYKENRFKPFDRTIEIIQQLEKHLKIQTFDMNPKQRFEKMMYGLYQKYSFTPIDIQEKIDSMRKDRDDFIDLIFYELNLKEIKKEKAKMDLDICFEKYISTNGDMGRIFKEDREAYLIKITSDDILQMTRIDTASTGNKPLQCTDAFFDGKKSILNTKECKVLHLCYNRKKGYLGSFTVQLSTSKSWGTIKMYYVPEEEDIQNVLQTIFENY